MAKITEYPQATKLDTGDVLLKDGTGGTKKMLAKDLAKELAPDIVGDVEKRVDDLEAAVEELSPITDINSTDLWEQGGIVSTTGGNASASSSTYTKRNRTTKEIPDNVIRIVNTAPDGFGYAVAVYTDRSWNAANWLGFYDNSGTVKTSSPVWITGDTDISDVKAAAQIKSPTMTEFCYRLVGANSASNYGVDTAPSDGVSLKLMAEVEETIAVDDTMSVKGMAADAKAVGLYLETIVPGITDITPIADWSDEGLYIALVSSSSPSSSYIANIDKPQTSSSGYGHYMVIEAQEGEVYTITVEGGNVGRAYGFVAENGAVLEVADASAKLSNTVVTAPSNTKWLVVNDTSHQPFIGRVYRGIFVDPHLGLPSMSGIPVLELTGSTKGMSKEQKVTLNYSIFDRTGTCTVKWQGSSSLRYAKKNYTVTFDNAMDAYVNWQNYRKMYGTSNGVLSSDYPAAAYDFSEGNSYSAGTVVVYDKHFYKFTEAHPAGEWTGTDANYAYPVSAPTEAGSRISFRTWGRQKKYCFKANYIDASHARNIVNARLWGRMVAARIAMGEITDARADSPNYGAIDGFPCEIKINGESQGLYTFNIPKDAWTFDMDEENDKHFVVGGENNGNSATKWMTATVVTDPTATGYGEDYGVEVGEDYAEAALTSINNAIAQANSPEAASDWETALADYVDINSVYDYFIFTCCIANNDALARNILYGTYDGTKWFMSAYDLDTTYGFNPYGTKIFRTEGEHTNFAGAAAMHKLAQLMVSQSRAKLKARYDLWRNGGEVNGVTVPAILSDESVWNEFAQFLIDIPSRDYRIDRDLWPMIPGTEVMTVSNYMEYYRAHCKALDEEIEALVGNSNG